MWDKSSLLEDKMHNYETKDFLDTITDSSEMSSELLIAVTKTYINEPDVKPELDGVDWWGGYQLDGVDFDINFYSTEEFGDPSKGKYQVDIYRYHPDSPDTEDHRTSLFLDALPDPSLEMVML
jgi:hypothetical protein